MNKVLLIGRMTRDPELRSLASGKNVTTFTLATNEYATEGKERAEYHAVVTWVTRPFGRNTWVVRLGPWNSGPVVCNIE